MTGWAEPGLVHRYSGAEKHAGPAPLSGSRPSGYSCGVIEALKNVRQAQSAPDDLSLLLSKNCILGGLGHAELDHTFRWDLDRLPSLWIPSHAGLAVRQYELADSRYHEDVLRFLVGQGSKVVHKLDGCFLG